MNYYQSRIAIDTAELLEELKRLYEEESGVTITKGNVIMKAYEDSLWVKEEEWTEIHGRKIKLPNHYEISPNSLKLRIQISKEVEQGIKDLKDLLPSILKVRSVTIGVCIRLILKAAYIKNVELGDLKSKELGTMINRYKEEVKSSFDDEISEKIIVLLDKLEAELEDKF
ncbi:hypothetical protein [Rummeliibacillus sp. BSL5]